MKKLVLSALVLGLASLGIAQEPKDQAKEIVLEGVIVRPPNFEYLAAVQDAQTPATVKVLERKAAYYDLEESPVYDDSFDFYEVFFSNNSGRVIATYDKIGQILKSYEKFKNIPVPSAVRNIVYSTYPDWKINKNSYVVSYYKDKSVKKTYHFQIQNGKKKKNLKMEWKGVHGS